jgi:hypothetical protein
MGEGEHPNSRSTYRAVMRHQGPKRDRGGIAMQVTETARAAGMVREDDNGNVQHRADSLYVYAFDDLCLVVDPGQVDSPERAELVVTAADDTDSIHHGGTTAIADAGHGYKLYLPGADAAGFSVEDGYTDVDLRSAPGVLFISKSLQARLVDDLATIRRNQTDPR